MTIFPRILKLLKEKGLSDVKVTGGGIIPAEDMIQLEKMGIDRLFGPGTTLEEIVEYFRSKAVRKKAAV
jgi:methylmalonyl-CoA mutase C-terminal domain/subunit